MHRDAGRGTALPECSASNVPLASTIKPLGGTCP
jgi:hypothetical protein